MTKGIAAPWFKQPGGGTQYMLDKSILELEDLKFFEKNN